ncbi:MAG: hypothetical protein NUV56_02030, partial [Candidatus Uhrbacteria bacterium]|nr:hypothetical protein [Candidatus Uhrbacteria bacterium]
MVMPVNRGPGREPRREERAEDQVALRLVERKIAKDEPVWILRPDGIFDGWKISTSVDAGGKKRTIITHPETFETKIVTPLEVLRSQQASDAKSAAMSAGKSHEEALAAARAVLESEATPEPVSKKDILAAVRILEEHRATGEPIMVLTKRGLKEMTVYSLIEGADGEPRLVACEDDSFCTDTIPVRVYLEDMRRQRTTAAGAGSPPRPPDDGSAVDAARSRGPVLATAAAGAGSPPPRGPRVAVAGSPAPARTAIATVAAGAGAPPRPPVAGAEKVKFEAKVGAGDISDELDARARDAIEANMTREKEQLRGFTGWLAKTFKHNYAREVYIQHGIRKARETILRDGLYAAEGGTRAAHDNAVGATVDRILVEYEGFIHEEAGEKKEKFGRGENETAEEKAIKARLVAIVKAYAMDPSMPREDFEAAKKRIFHDAARLKGVEGAGKMYADNVAEIAERLREHAAHAGGLENVDLDLDFTIARAKLGARTERERNGYDRAIAGLNLLTGGGLSAVFANELAVATASVWAIGTFLGQRGISSTLASWGTFGAGAGIAGLVAGFRERFRMHRDRALHERERAVNSEVLVDESMTDAERERKRADLTKQLNATTWRDILTGKKRAIASELANLDRSPRRVEMDQYVREKAKAEDFTRLMLGMLVDTSGRDVSSSDKNVLDRVASGEIRLREESDHAVTNACATLFEADARVRLSNKNGIDLLSYNGVTAVESERRDLDYARALLKAVIRRLGEEDGESKEAIDDFFAEGRKLSETTLYGEKSPNVAKDKAFNKLANRKGFSTGWKVAAGALVIGGVVHEGVALFGHNGPEIDPNAIPHTDVVGGGEFVLPDGITLEQLPDGTSRLVAADGSVIADGLHTLNGLLDEAAKAKL